FGYLVHWRKEGTEGSAGDRQGPVVGDLAATLDGAVGNEGRTADRQRASVVDRPALIGGGILVKAAVRDRHGPQVFNCSAVTALLSPLHVEGKIRREGTVIESDRAGVVEATSPRTVHLPILHKKVVDSHVGTVGNVENPAGAQAVDEFEASGSALDG